MAYQGGGGYAAPAFGQQGGVAGYDMSLLQQGGAGLGAQGAYREQQPAYGAQGGFAAQQDMGPPPTTTQPAERAHPAAPAGNAADDHDKWHADMMDKFKDLHERADKLHHAYGLQPANLMEEVKKDWNQTMEFAKGWHAGTIRQDNIAEKVPKWLIEKGENSCLAGLCLELPCIDPYAPNVSGCCCCHPWYSEKTYSFPDFFKEVMPQLHTGDLVFCSWIVEDISSSRFLMHSKWSHCGVIYRPSDCPDILTMPPTPGNPSRDPSRPRIAQFIMQDGAAFCLDDYEMYMKDYMDKHSQVPPYHKGEDPDTFSEFEVSVRFLDGVDRNRNFYQTIQNVCEKHKNLTYKMSPLSGIDLCQSNPCCFCLKSIETAEVDTNSMMCAEFVALMYQELGLINPELNPNEFIPPMFDSSRHLWLRKGATLSMQHSTKGPENLEERKQFGYGGQPGMEGSPGGGFYGTNTSLPIPICDHGQIPTGSSSTGMGKPPPQNTMAQPLLR